MGIAHNQRSQSALLSSQQWRTATTGDERNVHQSIRNEHRYLPVRSWFLPVYFSTAPVAYVARDRSQLTHKARNSAASPH
jgi:hypothetical protein